MNSEAIFQLLWPLFRKVLPQGDTFKNGDARDCAAHAAMILASYHEESMEDVLYSCIVRARLLMPTLTGAQAEALVAESAAALRAAGWKEAEDE